MKIICFFRNWNTESNEQKRDLLEGSWANWRNRRASWISKNWKIPRTLSSDTVNKCFSSNCVYSQCDSVQNLNYLKIKILLTSFRLYFLYLQSVIFEIKFERSVEQTKIMIIKVESKIFCTGLGIEKPTKRLLLWPW